MKIGIITNIHSNVQALKAKMYGEASNNENNIF